MELAKIFENELRDKMARAKKECGYNPTYFNRMLSEHGGLETAKILINKEILSGPTEGFTRLFMLGRLDLTVEASVCDPNYSSLFTREQIDFCKSMLGSR